MIASLRKRHKIIWTVMGIVLPLSFILITQAIPEQRFSPSLNLSNDTDPIMIAELINSGVRVDIKKNVRCAFCTVYGKTGNSQFLLGNISSVGQYEFKLDSTATLQKVVLFDEINKKELYTIDLLR